MSIIENYQGLLGIIGGLIGVGAAIAGYFRAQRTVYETIEKTKEEARKELDKVREERRIEMERVKQELELRIRCIEVAAAAQKTRFDVFWTVIEKEMTKVLIKPHRVAIDTYLIKMKEGVHLSPQEKSDLRKKMLEVLEDKTESDDLKIGYALIVASISSDEAVQRFYDEPEHKQFQVNEMRREEEAAERKEIQEEEEEGKENEKRENGE